MGYALREAAAAFRRAPLLVALSVVAVAFGLFVLGLFGLATYNIRRAIETIEDRVEVVAYLRDDLPAEEVQRVAAAARAMPGVLAVRHVSKAEALATAVREMEEFREVYTELESNPLPASLELRLQPDSRNPDGVARVAESLSLERGVEDVQFGREWVDKVFFLRRVAGGAALIIGLAFGAVAAIIIATAVRIGIFARREEISIMRLVGATDGFIRLPFLIEGFTAGLLGSLLAVLLTYATYQIVSAGLVPIEWLPSSWAFAGVAAGALFGLVASGISVHRHLGGV